MNQVFLSLWPLFSMIVGGYALKRWVLRETAFWAGMDRLNYFILLPALLFNGLVGAPLFNPALPRLLLGIVLVLLVCSLGLWLTRWRRGWPASLFGVHVQGIIRFNTYLGLAIVGSLFSQQAMTYAAIIIALLVPLVNVLAVTALTSGQHSSARALLWPIIQNPLILSCLAGMGANLLGLPMHWGLDRLLSQLGAASLPLGLLCVGAALSFDQLRGQYTALLSNCLLRLCLVPLVAWLCGQFMGLSPLESSILVVFFAIPTAPSAYTLARQLGGDCHVMAGIITLQTLLSGISMPVWLAIINQSTP